MLTVSSDLQSGSYNTNTRKIHNTIYCTSIHTSIEKTTGRGEVGGRALTPCLSNVVISKGPLVRRPSEFHQTTDRQLL